AEGGTLTSSHDLFSPDQGLRLTGGLADTANYTVVLVANLSSAGSFYKKVIDFQARGSDDGLYVAGSQLQLYPGASGPGTVAGDADFQLALTRDGASGTTAVYLNGVLQQTYLGAASDA